MDNTRSTTIDTTSKTNQWERDKISQLLEQILFDQDDGKSLNQSALENDVPRTTAQNWVRNHRERRGRNGGDRAY
jgi:transposase-like protein